MLFSFVGEAFFVVSFVAAIAFLASRNEDRRADMDRLVATSIGIGYPVFTAGALIFGAIWAETAWGSWWSWDPKETWALITWLLYTAYLHTRLSKKLQRPDLRDPRDRGFRGNRLHLLRGKLPALRPDSYG